MPQKILLIDGGSQGPLAGLLRDEGYEVTINHPGEDVQQHRPDLIIVDVEADAGPDLVESLSNDAGIPVVLVKDLNVKSGQEPPSPPVRRILYRPCRPKTMLEVVRDVLRST